jgi:hypothetical protein
MNISFKNFEEDIEKRLTRKFQESHKNQELLNNV